MSQLRMNIPAAFEETLTTAEQIEWLYRFKSAALEAGANIELIPDGDKIIITAVGEGFSPTVSVKEIPGGHEVTITDGTGPHTFDVMDGTDGSDGEPGQDGADGEDGAPGQDGEDGVSPTVSVEPLEEGNGYQVTITDADGPHTFNLYNGPRGYTGPQGPQGVQGVKGDDGVTPVITATATVNNQVGVPGVIVTKSGADTAPNFNFNFQNLKGDKGDKGDTGATGATGAQGPQGIQGVQGERGPQGLQGPQGETGATGAQGPQGPAGAEGPSGNDGISPEVTIAEITGGHSVTITDQEHPLGQTFNVMDGVDGGTGSQGPAGQDGVTPVITATATADALSSANPTVTVTKSGTDAAPSFAFAFSGLKGEQGIQGIQGVQGPAGQDGTDGQDGQNGYTPVITATASVDNVSSNNPTVAVTKTGTDAAPSFAFDFSGLKGATGAQGEQGIQGIQGEQGPAGADGEDGADGVTPVITATASADALSSQSPTVTVTKSGTDAAPTFAFAFSGLKGEQGAAGQNGTNGQGVPTGGTAGQVLSKVDGTDYNTEWVTPAAGGGGPEEWVDITSSVDIKRLTIFTSGAMDFTSDANFKILVKPVKIGSSTYNLLRFVGHSTQTIASFAFNDSAEESMAYIRILGGTSYTYAGTTYQITSANIIFGSNTFVAKYFESTKYKIISGTLLYKNITNYQGKIIVMGYYSSLNPGATNLPTASIEVTIDNPL